MKVLNGAQNTSLNCTNNTFINNTRETMCDLSSMKSYEDIHGYLAVTICVLGTIFNIVNILVLSHKDMRKNPINLLLTGIAVADMFVMMEYIPFAVHMYLLNQISYPEKRNLEDQYSYSWAVFLLFHANFTLILHGMSIWYTLVLAVWRLIMIRHHTRAVTLCTPQRCYLMIILGYVVPFLLTIPNLLAHDVHEEPMFLDKKNITIYSITFNKKNMYELNFWFYSLLLKLLPCILLSVITSLLIRALLQFSRVKRDSARPTDTKKDGSNFYHEIADKNEVEALKDGQEAPEGQMYVVSTNVSLKRKMRTDRTTRLLIVILSLFLISEFPQGIMGILSGYLGLEFFKYCYTPMGEIMDLLTLLNCMINFILYCTMSRQFRQTFRKIFKIRRGGRWCSLMKNCSEADKSSPVENIYIEKYLMVPVSSNNNRIAVATSARPEQRTV